MAYNDKYKGYKESMKGMVYFNGTGTLAIINSYNISSVTDGATGQYQVNFATSPRAHASGETSDASYCVAMGFRHTANNTPIGYTGHSGNLMENPTVYIRNTSNNGVDSTGVTLVFFGAD